MITALPITPLRNIDVHRQKKLLEPLKENLRASYLISGPKDINLESYKADVKSYLNYKMRSDHINIDVYDYFNKLLEKKESHYNGNNVLVILDNDYKNILTNQDITEENLSKFIEDNIKIIKEKYITIDDIDDTNLELFKLTDRIHEQRLKERQDLYSSIINDDELLPKFGQIFNVDKDKVETKLLKKPELPDLKSKMKAILGSFTLDFKTIFNKDTKFSPYLYMLTQNFDKITSQTELSIEQMIDNGIWKTPPFNNPRDYNLTKSTLVQYSYDKYLNVISFEYRLMEILLNSKILKNNFNEDQINFILGSYRNCVFGNNFFLDMYVNNSRYFDVAPFFKDHFDCLINDLCENKKKLRWNIQNNQLGIQNASHRRLIFPYVVIEDDIIARQDLKESSFLGKIGIFIFRTYDNYNRKYKYFIYYIAIVNDIFTKKRNIFLFDINKKIVYLKDSTFAYTRNQLLESKYAIEGLLKNLVRNKFEPYLKKNCDIIVFALKEKIEEKQLYFISLYNKDEILQIYRDLLEKFRQYIELFREIEQYIRFITENLVELAAYRFVNKDDKDKNKPYIFIWNIDPSEIGRTYVVSDKIRRSPCIIFAEYSNIYANNLENVNFYKGKEEMNLDIKKGELIKILIDLNKYTLDNGYKSFIDKQKEKIDKDQQHEKGKKEQTDEKYFYGRLSNVFNEQSDNTISKPNYENIFTRRKFYSTNPIYEQFIIEIGKEVKYYINLLEYTQDLEYKQHIDSQIQLLSATGYMYKYYNKYIKYKIKYLNLYNKIYNSNIL